MKIKEGAVDKSQIEKGRQESLIVKKFANNILKKNAWKILFYSQQSAYNVITIQNNYDTKYFLHSV